MTMTKPITLSAALVGRVKFNVRQEIEALRTMPAAPGMYYRAEINGRLRLMEGLGLIDAAEAQTLGELADAAQQEGEEAH
ncbi:hypothetical protein [Pseudomonas sp. UMAB-40]|uniref:hypothetical protein n=1 Tax=Pseudomonas sp. UMAB-40 TaxID=1365407 RepID=UPI001C5947EC|nr:hypothetical protein [Pseudomonas sp. UMAB-40]